MANQNHNYPTRMHEVLGVEPGEPFKIIGSQCIDDFCISVEGRLQHADNPGLACCRSDLEYAINNGITRRPRLTEEQVDELKAAVKLGLFWLAKDKSGTVSYYRDEPCRKSGCYQWFFGSSIQSLRPPQCSDVASLVSWSDPEPLSVAQALRDAEVD